jgi:hypothetical protein
MYECNGELQEGCEPPCSVDEQNTEIIVWRVRRLCHSCRRPRLSTVYPLVVSEHQKSLLDVLCPFKLFL